MEFSPRRKLCAPIGQGSTGDGPMRCLTFLVGTWRAAISYAAKCFSALKRKRPSMTDAELTALVAEVALTDPRSTPGVVAMLGLATKLAAEPEFADQPLRIV